MNKKRSTMIDVDHALTDILAQFYVAREHHFEYLEALYLAGDVNGNGVAIGEFELLLKLLDPSISKYSVLGSYRECQELTAKDNKPLADARANGKRKSEGGKQPITPEAFAYTVFTHPNFRVEPILHSVPSMKTVAGSLLKREHAADLDAQPPTHTNADIEAVIQSPAFNYHDWLVVELGEIWENKRPNILLGLNAISGAQQRQTVFNLISRIDCLLMGDLLVEAKAAWIAFDILMQETTALQSASMVQMYPLKQVEQITNIPVVVKDEDDNIIEEPSPEIGYVRRRNKMVQPLVSLNSGVGLSQAADLVQGASSRMDRTYFRE